MPARSKRYNEDRSGIVRCSWHGARLKGAYLHSRHCTRLGIVDATSVSTNRLSLLHSQILSVRGSKERNEERTSDRPTTSRIRNSHCHRIREFFFLLFPPPPPEESKNYTRLPARPATTTTRPVILPLVSSLLLSTVRSFFLFFGSFFLVDATDIIFFRRSRARASSLFSFRSKFNSVTMTTRSYVYTIRERSPPLRTRSKRLYLYLKFNLSCLSGVQCPLAYCKINKYSESKSETQQDTTRHEISNVNDSIRGSNNTMRLL